MARVRKLTPAQCVEIRRRHRLWRENLPKRICADYGVSNQTMQRVVQGKYRALGEP